MVALAHVSQKRWLRCAVALAAASLGLVGAQAAVHSDVYIVATVGGPVPKQNRARVAVSWDYKCLGGKLGEATYEWTLVAERLQPKPATVVTLATGKTQRGSLATSLAPGTWKLNGDPFLCETERGAGSDEPEVGPTVVVPDFCAWNVTSARGVVEVDDGSSVRRGRLGSVLRTGNVVGTPKGGAATIVDGAGRERVAIAAASSLTIGAPGCRNGTWIVKLGAGQVTATAAPSAASVLQVETANARATARGATWTVTTARSGTTVSVRKGTVSVRGRTGSPVSVEAGFRTTIPPGGVPTPPKR